MKTKSLSAAVILALALAITARAQVPGILNYQGRVIDAGTNFTGTGQFQFALINGMSGTTNYWSNDGTAVGQPTAIISNAVTKGLYSILLGDTTIPGMTVAVAPAVFANSDVRLRVWFNDGVSGFQQLTPDQRLAAAGYALNAASVASGSDVLGARLNIGVSNTLSGAYATIAGGSNNSALAIFATVGGGAQNTASGPYGTVGGGWQNNANTEATVAGGLGNIAGSTFSTVGGGAGNTAITQGSTVAGGLSNDATNLFADIAGGFQNIAGGYATVVGGGNYNIADGDDATIAGGVSNAIQGAATWSTVGGGQYNIIQPAGESTIGGGGHNIIQTNAGDSTISGGGTNLIQSGAFDSTIGGGFFNTIQVGASGSTIGGGYRNTASNTYATVSGGQQNIASGAGAFIGGGYGNTATVSSATIGGGLGNIVSNTYATVGGGVLNIASGVGAFIGGGGGDGFSLGGNTAGGAASVIGGGINNIASNQYATVPGGDRNVAGGKDSFAAGHRAKANFAGSFVWADSTDVDFSDTGNNQFCIRAAGGVQLQAAQAFMNFVSTNAVNGSVIQLINGTPSPTTLGAINFYNGGSPVGQMSYAVSDDSIRFRTGGADDRMVLNSGGLTVNGTFVSSSDRNAKENFKAVDARQVLEEVARMPVSRWNYKEDCASEHIGPMAQDFFNAFKVGPDDKHITTIDEEGVALAAIQGLNQKLEEQVKEKDTRIDALEKRLEKLESVVEKASEAVSPSTSLGSTSLTAGRAGEQVEQSKAAPTAAANVRDQGGL